MTTESAATLMEAAADIARIAGAVALAHFRTALTVETKGDGSPVTIADRAAERTVRDWIAARFPNDGVLGEEMGVDKPEARRRWIIDPIDGTKSFVRGVPLWGTLVAVCEGETVLAGAACFPAIDEIVAAAPGEGCWHNGVRARVSAVDRIEQATLLNTSDRFVSHPERYDRWFPLTQRAGISRTWGDCYGYLLVATGRADVMVDDRMSPWDAAALQPIIVEAGGVFTDWRGVATAFGGDAIATNAALSAEVRGVLCRDNHLP